MELEVLKALGDETRFAMYRELATSTTPLSAQDLADALGLHANTVRLHLERLRDAGLVDVEAIHRGTVGRPQHLYSLAAGAPGLGFDPPAHALLAGLLAAMAEQMGADAEAATATGRAWGVEAGQAHPEPVVPGRASPPSSTASVSSPRPTRTSARRDRPHRFPALPVPGAGRGLPRAGVQPAPGIVRGRGGRRPGEGSVVGFSTLYEPDPCHVVVAVT